MKVSKRSLLLAILLQLNLTLFGIEYIGCSKSYSINTITESPTTTEIYTTESLPITCVLISGTIFTSPEHISPKISKIGLNRGTKSITERHTSTATVTVYSTKPVLKPIIAHSTVTIHATKTIYLSTTVHTSKYSSPSHSKKKQLQAKQT